MYAFILFMVVILGRFDMYFASMIHYSFCPLKRTNKTMFKGEVDLKTGQKKKPYMYQPTLTARL